MKILRIRALLGAPLLLSVTGCFNPEPPRESADTGTSTGIPADDTAQTDGASETGDPVAECGNGIVEGDEACDEGEESATCNADCRAALCGDGYVNQAAGEICDDGNDDPDDGCNTMCMPLDCGDGIVVAPESCDDGNRDQSDACVVCQDAACGDGFTQAGVEECDDGNADDTDDCPSMCIAATCGDGFVLAGGEACDDGNADDSDGCLSSCDEASCGDGFVQAGVEACDDGNADDTDDCLSTCMSATCGDGFVHSGVEECDDANGVPDDGCDSCVLTCGDDCWSDAGCITDEGRCIRFTCTSGADSATACDTCFGWQPVTYDQWMNGGYCGDVIARYRVDHGTTTMCGGPPLCCSNPADCGGTDNAWHFFDGVDNYFVGPCLGCADDINCQFWDDIDNNTYTRITACERPAP